jgi:signal transduction histidine kinase
MTASRIRAVVAAAIVCGAIVVALALRSDHLDDKVVWAIFGPAVGWSFIGTGLYAARRRPESRTGQLMVLLGFAWFVAGLSFANSALVYSAALVLGGLWGGVFLQLVIAFPSGVLRTRRERAIVLAGYLLFTVGSVPALLVSGPHELGCDGCPANVLLVGRDPDLAAIAAGVETALYIALFVVTLVHLAYRWRGTDTFERLQLTPVYVCGLLTFLLVTIATAGAGNAVAWAGFAAMALLPFAFLGGLLRSHVAHLDAQLRDRIEELRASRARVVEAGDTARRQIERDLHDGAQARLVGVALLIGHARRRVDVDPEETAALLDQAMAELKLGLAELRELARGIHPTLLTDRGLDAALHALAARAAVPVTLETDGNGRLPEPVEIAAYFVVSEALQNVAKYARATCATVAVHHDAGRVTVEVADDGVGGADAANGSGLRGLADRVGALDGTIAVQSPRGGGTRVHVEIPCGVAVGPGAAVQAEIHR